MRWKWRYIGKIQSNWSIFYCGLVLLLFSVTTAVGVYLHYSPVPFSDSWDGIIAFYAHVTSGHLSIFWAQHNEHRIILSRLLFFLDMWLSNGNFAYLVALNVVLACLSVLVFYLYLARLFPLPSERWLRYSLLAIVSALLLSWMQYGNFTWEFQSQYFLAYLLPLAGFFSLATSQGRRWPFLRAAALGVTSVGSMANGVLVLPLMAALAVVLRLGKKRVAALSGLAILCDWLYFRHYHKPGQTAAPLSTLLHHPEHSLLYVLTYLGNPVHYLFHISGLDLFQLRVGQMAGLGFIAGIAYVTSKQLRGRDRQNYRLQWALVAFLLYILGTAVGTAGGRLVFGILEATSSRYTTPVLMGWAALFILVAWSLRASLVVRPRLLVMPAVLVPLILLPGQVGAIGRPKNQEFDKRVAALALELGIRDPQYTKRIYPRENVLVQDARPAIQYHQAVFGTQAMKSARTDMGRTVGLSGGSSCLGHLDTMQRLKGDPQYVRISGWLFDRGANEPPTHLLVVNSAKNVVGYALTGAWRPDVRRAVGGRSARSGFVGYATVSGSKGKLVLWGEHPRCSLAATSKLPFYSVGDDSLRGLQRLVSARQVAQDQWWPIKVAGLTKSPSLLTAYTTQELEGDAHHGMRLRIDARPNESILYSTGPHGGGQVAITTRAGRVLSEKRLAPSHGWRLMMVAGKWLPPSFILEFKAADGSDRWTSVAVRAQ